MLHHHGGAGYPYNAPTTGAVPFSPPPPLTSIGPVSVTSIPRPPMQLQPVGTSAFAELPADGPGGSAAGNFQDDDVPADVSTSRVGASSSGGNRWPREETLALIRIRSEMDADFRNAPFKAPLWEDVTRKLAGLGYQRSAKKCKEKFENVDKYYKRTKDARAGRQDGKSYRFFSQLEALHAAAPPPPQQQTAAMSTAQADRHPLATMAWTTPPAPPGASLPDPSFSSMSGSGSESDDEFDHDEEEGLDDGGGCDKKMVALFEGMMRQVTAKQDAMQRAFLETLERWEAERTAREEAWRLQEVARMNREQEQLSRERAAAASRDAALIAFLQRVGDGLPPPASAAAGPAPAPMPGRALPLPHHRDAAATTSLQAAPVPPPKAEEASWAWAGGGESGGSSTSSRWPKEEVQALIQLRTEKDEQDHDAGSKGPLWEDIAAGMRRIGYNRSAKRCKEKWENINKYFKKVKECNKRRPEDSKTCPYFHQLDAMYRKKRFAGRGGTAGSGTAPGAGSGQENLNQRELDGKSINDAGKRNTDGESSVHAPAGKVETAPTTTALSNGAKSKKADDIVRETNVQLLQQEFTADETDSDGMGGNYADEGNDEDKMQYKMGFQKPSVIGSSGNAAATSPAAPTSSTFLDVQ